MAPKKKIKPEQVQIKKKNTHTRSKKNKKALNKIKEPVD
jgi:hypothetical protein